MKQNSIGREWRRQRLRSVGGKELCMFEGEGARQREHEEQGARGAGSPGQCKSLAGTGSRQPAETLVRTYAGCCRELPENFKR